MLKNAIYLTGWLVVLAGIFLFLAHLSALYRFFIGLSNGF